MANVIERCEGALVGHAIASCWDPSIVMTRNICESLLEKKKFDGPDVLSRYLYSYHSNKSEIGQTTKCIYDEVIARSKGRAIQSAADFILEPNLIPEIVELAHKKCDSHTAGCGPAHRSYPLAFCNFISDNDLFNMSMTEAKLTHHDPIAGQVAGIVNLICRSLIKKASWNKALELAFVTPRLHPDIQCIFAHHFRSSLPWVEVHPAYGPTALHAALHVLATSHDPAKAMENIQGKVKTYALPIIGILSGVRWGIPVGMYKDVASDEFIKSLRDKAALFANEWPEKYVGPVV